MFYTQPKDNKRIFVIEKDEPLKKLNIDNCFLLEKENSFVALPAEYLFNQKPFYPFDSDNAFLYVNKQKVSPCSLCNDQLNNLTKNCSWGGYHNDKQCNFKPAQYIGEGDLSEIQNRTYIKPNLTLSRTFSTSFDYDDVDFKRIDENKTAWKIRKNLPDYIKEKEANECKNCLFECRLDSYQIQKKCQYTPDDLKKSILPKVTKEFGSIDNFLTRIIYTGKFGLVKISDKKRATTWVVGLPDKDNYFLTKTYHPYTTIKVSKDIIERTFSIGMIPPEKEKIALMAYASIEIFGKPHNYSKKYTPAYFYNNNRFIGVSPVKDGIKLHYIECRYNSRVLQHLEFTDIKNLVSSFYLFRSLNKNI